MSFLRRFVNQLYLWSGALACFFLAGIAFLVLLQIFTRLAGFNVSGLIDYATYSMVASAFLGIAITLKRGAHIRVGLVIGSLPETARRALEIAALSISAGVMAYFTWYCVLLTYDSWRFGYLEMGLAATPLWIPQTGMALGAAIGTLAFIDELFLALTGQTPGYLESEQAFSPLQGRD